MKKLMLGNEAVARGAYEAGVSVVSSYPGTPSTEITENIVKYDDIYVEWAPNEKVAAEVAIGASIAGARSMSCMKHVGLNVMADPVFTASYTGVNGGLVLCVADDQGMHSSQNEQDSRHYAKASKILMLEPSDSGECKEFTKTAYELSEKYDTPVFLRLSTRVSHSQSLVEEEEKQEVALKDYEKNPQKYVMMPGNAIKRHVVVEDRINALKEMAETSPLNRVEENGSKIGIIAGGIAYMYAKEALGDKADYLKIGIVYPLPEKKIKEFASKYDKVFVIEELDPVIEDFCKSVGVDVIGKDVFTLQGEYTPSMIKKAVLGTDAPEFDVIDEPTPVRPPVMCAGCPHRGTFYVLKKLGLVVSGDIGCYTLGAVAPLSVVDTTICMGASISSLHGMEKAKGKEYIKNWVAVIGDSTFLHTGVNSLMNMMYNKATGTVMILDNSTTGMTGHQDHAATGKTLQGDPTYAIDIPALCRAIGVKNVIEVNAFDIERLEKVIKEEVAKDEVSVIITKTPCVLLSKKKKPLYAEEPDKCKKCGMCMKPGCPAMTRNADKTIHIDDTMCTGCGLCKSLCKFDAIKLVREGDK